MFRLPMIMFRICLVVITIVFHSVLIPPRIRRYVSSYSPFCVFISCLVHYYYYVSYAVCYLHVGFDWCCVC